MSVIDTSKALSCCSTCLVCLPEGGLLLTGDVIGYDTSYGLLGPQVTLLAQGLQLGGVGLAVPFGSLTDGGQVVA